LISRLVAWSARHPVLVALVTLALALAGEWSRRGLPRDAIPDLSDPQVVLVADWMGHPAPEVATQVTTVLTRVLDGVPGAEAVRGSSMSGMAFVAVVFSSPADLARGRAEIVERVEHARASLPATVRVQVGPEASNTGWVFEYILADPTHRHDAYALRRLQEDVVRPMLAQIPGVGEVGSVGGQIREWVVEASPDRLREAGLALTDLRSALETAEGEARDAANLEEIPIGPPDSRHATVRVRDVARIRSVEEMPGGFADYDGALEAVGGIVVARRDADVAGVVERVRDAIADAEARLPLGVKLVTVYDRSTLAARVEQTLAHALGQEVVAVVLVILVFLLHGRSALVPLLTLPLVVLVAFAGMRLLRIPVSVMSLGGIAIALGMAVDAEVVALEACHRSLEAAGGSLRGEPRRSAIVAAVGSFAPAILTSLVIAAIAFLPVLAFSGETGRLLHPLALTKTLVIASAALVTLLTAPALRDVLLRGRVVPELANPITRVLVRLYRPFVYFALRRPVFTLATAALAVASCLPLVWRLGREFLPRLDEGDLLNMPTTAAGVPPMQAAMQVAQQDRAIAAHEEVASVFGKIGRADTATDPAPYSMAETTVRLHPRSEWPRHARERWYSSWAPPALRQVLALAWPDATPLSVPELVDALDRDVRRPGWTAAWTAPARARMDMMATGVRTPVGVRVSAANPERLAALSAQVVACLRRLPGTKSALDESGDVETWPRFAPDPAALARFGADANLVQSTADWLLAGGLVVIGRSPEGSGQHGSGGQRAVVRMASDGERGPDQRLRDVTVRAATPGGSPQPVPLDLLGHSVLVTAPAVVRAEGGRLASYVYVDLSDAANVGQYVEDARRALATAMASGSLSLGPGEAIDWTGQYQLLAAGERRLMIIVPVVCLSTLVLLLAQFRSVAQALIVLASVPFALVGSFWTLFVLGYPLSAPVWVGLLSVVGLAMQTATVMVVYIDDAFYRRLRQGQIQTRDDVVAAHAEGSVRRLRPKVMTIATMAAGLLPLLWSEGAGAEIMRRVAAPMLGGLVTSAMLTLEVLPVLYTIWRFGQLARAQRSGTPLEMVVGPPPRWAMRT
jgi:Cu(I)/Ag(I) efflux system membrane protein CusA/SilA